MSYNANLLDINMLCKKRRLLYNIVAISAASRYCNGMTHARSIFTDDPDRIPHLPAWITSARAEALEDVAFLSGAAISHLHFVLSRTDAPENLLRDRLALRAAEVLVARSRRFERAAELRDVVQFLQPGDLAGPAGETYLSWRRAVERPISVKALHRAIPTVSADKIAAWLDAGQGAPVTRAAMVLEVVLKEAPRAEGPALILADAALAQALGWAHLVPLLACGLKRNDLRKNGNDLRLACHRAVTGSAQVAIGMTADLAMRTARLTAVVPKLRAKGAAAAVELFRTRDAVSPGALTSLSSDRAARRLCDRLIELGVVRELTGRDTFRLYGV